MLWLNVFQTINIGTQSVITFVNGVTSSLSIIIGFFGVFIGIMLHEIGEKDKKARDFLFRTLFSLALPLILLWTTYSFLSMGEDWFLFAIKYVLSALLITFYMLLAIIIYVAKTLKIE